MSEKPQGPLLRLSGLPTAALPPPSAPADQLRSFMATLLGEAVPFLDSVPTTASTSSTTTEWKPKGTKRFPESDAPVDVTERVVRLVAEGREETETWACRRSVHADAARRGTASWVEFVDCLRDQHAETEEAFTPTVLGHRTVVAWGTAGEVGTIRLGEESLSPGQAADARQTSPPSAWGGFAMAVVEVKHKLPPPLRPRVFCVLQVSCTAVRTSTGSGQEERQEEEEFVVVSVPVQDLATGGWKDEAALSMEKGVVVGAYAAVERVRRLVPASGGDQKAEVEWVMATASDAKGVLPMWLQTRAVPGQVAKDVRLFLGWVDGERKK